MEGFSMSNLDNMVLVAGSASQLLTVKISRLLGLKLVPVSFKRFPDGELYVRLLDSVEGCDVIVVQSTPPPQDSNLIELFLLVNGVIDQGANSVTAVIPYLAYARQDKAFLPGEAVSGRYICRMLCDCGVNKVITVNIHNTRVFDGLNVPFVDLNAAPLIGEHFKSFSLKNPIVLAPDEGACKEGEAVARILDCNFVFLEKHRDKYTGEIVTKEKHIDVSGSDVIIVDDIISTGGTVVNAISMAVKQGARAVHVACVHPLLIGDARLKIFNAGARSLVGTDSVPSDVSLISLAPLIAGALES